MEAVIVDACYAELEQPARALCRLVRSIERQLLHEREDRLAREDGRDRRSQRCRVEGGEKRVRSAEWEARVGRAERLVERAEHLAVLPQELHKFRVQRDNNGQELRIVEEALR